MTHFVKSAILSAAIVTTAGTASADDEATLINGYLLDDTLTIAENAAKVEDFTVLMAAVSEAGLVDELLGEGPYTVFAPTNDAFAKLPEGTVEDLLLEENRDVLVDLVSAHVVAGEVTASEFDLAELGNDIAEEGEVNVDVENNRITMDTITTADLTVEKIGDEFYVSAFPTISESAVPDATIIYSDIMSSNGVIHIIDSVLSPDA